MDYTQRLQNVTILGAAGKMGSGITLLTAMEMARLAKMPENNDKKFVLKAMDLSEEGLQGLVAYIRKQATRAAIKKVDKFKPLYPGLSDEEVAAAYANDVLAVLQTANSLEAAYDASLVFEAVSENPDLKVKLFNEIEANNKLEPWYFTNTSSVPIHLMDEKSNLGGRVIGFHFYNPPAIQKLVELIKAENTLQELDEFAKQYAKSLRKIVVPSNDFAGFIGNGHFMRDALHGINEAERLAGEYSFPEAVYMMNKVSQQFLVRPMGIFQLIDYVGVDVCQYIMKVMNPYLKAEDLHSPLLDKLLGMGVRGGQNSDGSQKDGFLKYEGGRPVAVFDPGSGNYADIANFKEKCGAALGPLATACKPWKEVIGSPEKEALLKAYFEELAGMDTLGAGLSKRFLTRSKEIGNQLVDSNVANNAADVNTVLMTGFFHAYGPINDYI